jgi:hypothetical protein
MKIKTLSVIATIFTLLSTNSFAHYMEIKNRTDFILEFIKTDEKCAFNNTIPNSFTISPQSSKLFYIGRKGCISATAKVYLDVNLAVDHHKVATIQYKEPVLSRSAQGEGNALDKNISLDIKHPIFGSTVGPVKDRRIILFTFKNAQT